MPPSSNSSAAPHYLSLAIRLPSAATSSQRRQNKTGVSIDMILDTGSSVNVIQQAVANELALSIVGMQPAGSGAGGGISSAPIFLLGDVQFDHLAPEERFTVMSGLQAASLLVPSPSSAGILGRPFLDSFPAVEFVFGDTSDEIRFYSSDSDVPLLDGRRNCIQMSVLGVSGLWGVEMMVRGSEGGDRSVTLKALVDTGAPSTILNVAAAEALGLNAVFQPPTSPPLEENKGLLGSLMSMVGSGGLGRTSPPPGMGVAGLRVSPSTVSLSIQNLNPQLSPTLDGATPSGASSVDLGSFQPWIGVLPGFAVLGVDVGDAAAILGLDALRSKGSLVLLPLTKQMLL